MLPTNEGHAKCDVMCADPSPRLAEDQQLMHPQAGEPGQFSYHIHGGLERKSQGTEALLCYGWRGQSYRPLDFSCLPLYPQLMGALSSQGIVPFVTPVGTEGTLTGLCALPLPGIGTPIPAC